MVNGTLTKYGKMVYIEAYLAGRYVQRRERDPGRARPQQRTCTPTRPCPNAPGKRIKPIVATISFEFLCPKLNRLPLARQSAVATCVRIKATQRRLGHASHARDKVSEVLIPGFIRESCPRVDIHFQGGDFSIGVRLRYSILFHIYRQSCGH